MEHANIEEALLSAVAGSVAVSDFTLALWRHVGPSAGDILPSAWLKPFEPLVDDTVSMRGAVRQ